MCGGHRTHHYVLNLCNLVINVDPVFPIPYLSPFLLNLGIAKTAETQTLDASSV